MNKTRLPSGMSFARSTALVTLGANAVSGSKVLLLADEDGASTTALANSIAEAGFLVTVRPAPEYTWDGTNPSLDGYDLVIHLNGNTFSEGQTLSANAQSALVAFVQGGGGFIGSQWSSLEALGEQAIMRDLVLMDFGGAVDDNCFSCPMTYTTVTAQQGHPVLAGVPSPFTFDADGHVGGPLWDFPSEPSTVLMTLPSEAPGVVVRSLGGGKVVNFSFAPNYGLAGDGLTLRNGTIQQLYINAVGWAARSSAEPPAKSPATITLGYPTTTFDGTPKAISAVTNPAGLTGLTVTYSQGGVAVDQPVNAGSYDVLATLDNPDYEAPQATGIFTIRPATPVIHWTPPASVPAGTILGAAQLNASATGVGGTGLVGRFVYLPEAGTALQAGTQPLSVEFLPDDANYSSAIKTVLITVTSGRSLKFRGFFRPVHNLPFVNQMKEGRSIAVKFSVEGADQSGALQGSPTSIPVTCRAGAPERPVEETGHDVASRMRITGNMYTYTWKTNAAWAGTCRKLVVTLVDGSRHEALFRFGKKPTLNGGGNHGRNAGHGWNRRAQARTR